MESTGSRLHSLLLSLSLLHRLHRLCSLPPSLSPLLSRPVWQAKSGTRTRRRLPSHAGFSLITHISPSLSLSFAHTHARRHGTSQSEEERKRRSHVPKRERGHEKDGGRLQLTSGQGITLAARDDDAARERLLPLVSRLWSPVLLRRSFLSSRESGVWIRRDVVGICRGTWQEEMG